MVPLNRRGCGPAERAVPPGRGVLPPLPPLRLCRAPVAARPCPTGTWPRPVGSGPGSGPWRSGSVPRPRGLRLRLVPPGRGLLLVLGHGSAGPRFVGGRAEFVSVRSTSLGPNGVIRLPGRRDRAAPHQGIGGRAGVTRMDPVDSRGPGTFADAAMSEEHASQRSSSGPIPRRNAPGRRHPSGTPLADPLSSAADRSVDGHRVRYGVVGYRAARRCSSTAGGCGPTPTARPIEAMAAAGCRVYAPRPARVRRDPRARRRSSGPSPATAAWVGRFLDAVGERRGRPGGRPLVRRRRGHRLRPRPARTGWRPCCWPTPIGSPTWALFPNEVRTMMQRPFWDWGRHFGGDLPRTRRGCSACCPTLLEDFVPNLVRNPLGMFRTGEFIRRADLVRGGPDHRRARASRSRWPGPTATAWCPGRPSTSCATPPASRGWWSRGPRLADRRPGAPSASWPSAPWSTRGALGAAARVRREPCRDGRDGRPVAVADTGGSLSR